METNLKKFKARKLGKKTFYAFYGGQNQPPPTQSNSLSGYLTRNADFDPATGGYGEDTANKP